MPRAITEIVYECPHCAKYLAADQSLSDVYAEVLTTRSWLCVTSSAPPKNFRLNVYKLQSRVHVHIFKRRNRKSQGYGSAGKETVRTGCCGCWVRMGAACHYGSYHCCNHSIKRFVAGWCVQVTKRLRDGAKRRKYGLPAPANSANISVSLGRWDNC